MAATRIHSVVVFINKQVFSSVCPATWLSDLLHITLPPGPYLLSLPQRSRAQTISIKDQWDVLIWIPGVPACTSEKYSSNRCNPFSIAEIRLCKWRILEASTHRVVKVEIVFPPVGISCNRGSSIENRNHGRWLGFTRDRKSEWQTVSLFFSFHNLDFISMDNI